jgi:bacteriorhodopsin
MTALPQPNDSLTWFKRLMWLGIIANFAVALVSIAAPDKVLALLQLPAATPLVWPRFACFLLLLMSLFYVAAARDPVRNAYAASMAVIARFGGVAFFAVVGGNYILFGLFDLVFGLPQALLLFALRRKAGG